MINGNTVLIAHLGFPTHSFKAPMIYNPYFEARGINAVVVPMGVTAEHYPQTLAALRRLENFHGALVTMPHKVSTVGLLDEATPTVTIAGSCNAIRRRGDGALQGDMFDGEGFVRGVRGKGHEVNGARVFIAGTGGVGCAIAASLARAGAAHLSLFDIRPDAAQGLAQRLAAHYPNRSLSVGNDSPAGHDIVVNATPLGMEPDDPLPMDVTQLAPEMFVGEVVMTHQVTPFLRAARERGCPTQVGTDMLFEQIPAYLEFFGFGRATVAELRAVARVE